MEKKSLRKQIWELLSPMLVRGAVVFVVELIIVTAYCMQFLPELMEVAGTQEALTEKLLEITEGIYDYVLEITAVASLVTIPFLIFMRKRDLRKEAEAGILQNKKASLKKYLLVAGISVSLALALNNIITLSSLAEQSIAYQEAAEMLYMPSLPVQIVCVGVIVPICEELLFRGLIYKRLRRNMSFMNAVVFSAIFFGAYHVNIVQFLYGTVCGLLLAYVYEKYGSIMAPIMAHMLMNIVVCILTDVNGFTWMFSQPMRMALITAACAGIATTMFLLIRQIDEKPETEVLQKC